MDGFRPFDALDNQGEFHGGRLQFDRFLGGCVLRTVDNVRPLHQVCEILGFEPNRSRATVAMNMVQERKVGS